jgi:hypothetical protein
MIRAFAYKVIGKLKDTQFRMLPLAFPGNLSLIGSIYVIRRAMEKISGVKFIAYDCCIESCMLFYGPFGKLDVCLLCKRNRYNSKGGPRKQYRYIPLIPRLVALYLHRETARLLQTYRHEYSLDSDIEDIFDGTHYKLLRFQQIEVRGQKIGRRHFEERRDLALGFSWDGFGPFKRRTSTCWPEASILYSIPPTDRVKLHNIIPHGCIPGPKQMKDPDSFLLPLIDEAIQLELGVPAFDAYRMEHFVLHAFFLTGFGDIPAVSKLMRMKGVNAYSPCRMCTIKGVLIPGSSKPYYVPLSLRDQPIDPLKLPLRTQEQFLRHAHEVSHAPTGVEEKRRSRDSGIKGIPAFSLLSSIRLPTSFPADFMHLEENLLPELADLWAGDYKGLDLSNAAFVLPQNVRRQIGADCKATTATLPASFGCGLEDPWENRQYYTAERWSQWAMFGAPVLLRGRFQDERYYHHFLDLVRLINLCISFPIKRQDVQTIRIGFAQWVQDFER